MSTAPPVAGAGTKPNIILMMADDMGYSDIGCFGSEINTPNLGPVGSRRDPALGVLQLRPLLPHPRGPANRPCAPRSRDRSHDS